MPVPATNGVLRTRLEDMKIGDYIKCVYDGFSENSPGDFKFMGELHPTHVVNDAETEYNELPTEPQQAGEGYFYFLKVDTGLLVADRRIQSKISSQKLNIKNYLKGSNIRCLTSIEWDKYITKSDLNGNIIIADLKVWNTSLSDHYAIDHMPETITEKVEICQNLTARVKSVEKIIAKKNERIYDTDVIAKDDVLFFARAWTTPYWGVIYKNIQSLIYHDPNPFFAGGVYTSPIYGVYFANCFRPAYQYIDNDKSTNIFY